MTNLINEYRNTKEAIKQLQERLESMQKDERLAKDLEFEEMIRAAMAEYGKTSRDVILMLDPSYGAKAQEKPAVARRQRVLQVYKNPHTGAVIETKGGNHKELKAWKAEYGAETVASWLQ